MAMITCPECKKKISENADNCPNCGYQLTPEKIAEIKKKQQQVKKGCGIGCLSVIVIFLMLVFFGKCFTPEEDQLLDTHESKQEVLTYLNRLEYLREDLETKKGLPFLFRNNTKKLKELKNSLSPIASVGIAYRSYLDRPRLGQYKEDIYKIEKHLENFAASISLIANEFTKLGPRQDKIAEWSMLGDFSSTDAHSAIISMQNRVRKDMHITEVPAKTKEKADAVEAKTELNAETYYNIGGISYGKLGRYQEAIEAFKQAIKIKPDYSKAHYNLGLVYYKLERYQEAIEAFKQAIRIDPDFADAHFNLGVCYLLNKDKDSALGQYKILKELDKDLAEKLYNEIYK